VIVGAFEPDAKLRWSDRYDGAAGLTDTVRSFAIADDGSVHVLVHENEIEAFGEEGNAYVESRLVLLRFSVDGTREWRHASTLHTGWVHSSQGITGFVGIAGGEEPVIVERREGADASVVRLDRWGNPVSENTLALPSYISLRDLAVTTSGDLILAGRRVAGRGWLARASADGTLAWSIEVRPYLFIDMQADGTLVVASIEPFDVESISLGAYDLDGRLLWQEEIELAPPGASLSGVAARCDGSATIVAEAEPMRRADSVDASSIWLYHVDALQPRRNWSVQHGIDGLFSFMSGSLISEQIDGDLIVASTYRGANGFKNVAWLARFRRGGA
jgi:hypothetical protein